MLTIAELLNTFQHSTLILGMKNAFAHDGKRKQESDENQFLSTNEVILDIRSLSVSCARDSLGIDFLFS